MNHVLKVEREIWGLLDGPWDGLECNTHRRAWASKVKLCCMLS